MKGEIGVALSFVAWMKNCEQGMGICWYYGSNDYKDLTS